MRRPAGLRIGALDETGQEKKGQATAGVKRQHMGCAGGVDNGINTVHLSYVREKTGHALIGARQWIPCEQVSDPVRSLITGLPPDLAFRTKGQLAIDILADARADGVELDFVCGDEVYGSCAELRDFLREQDRAYVLRVPSNFRVALAGDITVTCAEAVRRLNRDGHRPEVRSAGNGSKGSRWYAWTWLGTASACHTLLIRRHLRTGDLAFHYCYVPRSQKSGLARLVRAAGQRWPVEEDFQLSKTCFGLDQSQVRLYTAITRHTVLVMAALAICAITAARLCDPAARAPSPARSGQRPPRHPGMVPLSIPEIRRLIAAPAQGSPPGHTWHWIAWRRRHQARSRWHHQRTRLTRDTTIIQLST
jgi:SRSO17 transposase